MTSHTRPQYDDTWQVYAASLFMWPISKFADEPYYGRARRENRRRSHQGSLFLQRALMYIKKYYPVCVTGPLDVRTLDNACCCC